MHFLVGLLNQSVNCVDVNYLDYEKTFDKVPQRILLARLKAMGIDGKIME